VWAVRSRLEVESIDVAKRFRAADAADQRRVTEQLIERALAAQDPPLDIPPDEAALRALVAELDASDDEADFRRARAGAAVEYLRRAAYEDALYEALHARHGIAEAVSEALDALT
jgi:hypothetical protein